MSRCVRPLRLGLPLALLAALALPSAAQAAPGDQEPSTGQGNEPGGQGQGQGNEPIIGPGEVQLETTAAPTDQGRPRRHLVEVGIGPGVYLPDSGGLGVGGIFGRIPLSYQYRLRPGRKGGLAFGLQAPLNFDRDSFGMNIGPVVSWDFYLAQVRNATIYVTPLISTGYGFTAFLENDVEEALDPEPDDDVAHFWYITLAAEVKVMWRDDRIGVFVRPLSFDAWANDDWVNGNYAPSAGLAIAF